jgi:hypothetical protein
VFVHKGQGEQEGSIGEEGGAEDEEEDDDEDGLMMDDTASMLDNMSAPPVRRPGQSKEAEDLEFPDEVTIL